MLDFGAIVRKYIRLPWKVYSGQKDYRDRELAATVAHECGATDAFKQEPAYADLDKIFLSIAPMITLELDRNIGGEEFRKRNVVWPNLPQAERDAVLQTLNLRPAQHDSVLLLEPNNMWRHRLTSYIAAAYAFTTYRLPYVMTFDQLTHAAFDSIHYETHVEKAMRSHGLLIILGAGAPRPGADKVYGFLSTVLEQRMRKGLRHMFIDVPEGELMEALSNKETVTRKQVSAMYSSLLPMSYRMGNWLHGENVYIVPVDWVDGQEIANERRKTTII